MAPARSLAKDLPSSQRALTVAAATVMVEPRHARFHRTPRNTSFLAQLIATASGLPQTRERCRAEPAEAIGAYRSTMARLAPARPR